MITLNSAEVKAEVKNKVIYTIFITYLKEIDFKILQCTFDFQKAMSSEIQNLSFI